jgi:RNA polymerase sigma-70 factor (ECF subfamily)
VLEAGQRSSSGSPEALAELCESYWYPLYAYVRRRVADPHDALDLVQEFFSRLLDKNIIAVADPSRGRFRAFLLTSLRHFLADQWDKSRAKKRGGDRAVLSFEVSEGETRYMLEPADELTPERLYDRQWTITLLDRVMGQLRDELVRAGKQAHFAELSVFLSGRQADVSYATAARALGISEGAAMVAAHRMRRRYHDLLRAEIAETVASPDEIDDEIRRLFASLNS